MTPPTIRLLSLFLLLLLTPFPPSLSSPPPPATVCIIGSGIGGSSVAHFLRTFSPLQNPPSPIGGIHIFERNGAVGGRMATVNLAGETFEAGASVLHPKNFHASNFTQLLGLNPAAKESNDDRLSLGIWDGSRFAFKTLTIGDYKYPILQKIVDQINSLRLFWRYGVSLLRMDTFIKNTLDKFLNHYNSHESRPIFETVEEMLQYSGLYNLTSRPLEEELLDAGLSPLLIKELVTVITRVNYGQSDRISGLAGGVSLAGSTDGLWAVEGGNWQMAAGLIENSDVVLHLNEEISAISHIGSFYELDSFGGNSYACDVVVVATPLDELNIQFNPPVSVPERKMQHTFTTFVRGLLNPAYFGLASVSEIPILVGTLEDSNIPFSSISILKKHDKDDFSYKVFSRNPLDDALLDQIFSVRKDTVKIDWAAYPHYSAPESFAPFVLDGLHLYYVNAFENAASTMETSAVSAENISRLILSRLARQTFESSSDSERSDASLHVDL